MFSFAIYCNFQQERPSTFVPERAEFTKLFAHAAAHAGFRIYRGLLALVHVLGGGLEGVGVVLAVLSLLLILGYNNTAYYPSIADINSSLTIQNSSSSPYTLKAMSIVSLLIPFVLAYIFFAWRAIDRKKITRHEMGQDEEIKY